MKVTKRGAMLGIAIVLTGAFAAVLPFRGNLAHAFRLATTRQSEHFSELYFSQPDDLPKTLLIDQAADVGFVVTNHEGSNYTYRYQAVFLKDGQATASRTGAFTMEDGQTSTQNINIPAQGTTGQLQVVIQLIDKNQTIHFHSEVVDSLSYFSAPYLTSRQSSKISDQKIGQGVYL